MSHLLQSNLRRSRRANRLGYLLYALLALVLAISVVVGLKNLLA